MRSYLHFAPLAGLSLLLALPSSAIAAPIPYTVNVVEDTELNLHIVISGGAITEDEDDEVIIEELEELKFWRVENVTLQPDDEIIDDEMDVNWEVEHKAFFIAATGHSHSADGDTWDPFFDLSIDSEDLMGGKDTDTSSATMSHGNHQDKYEATLTGFGTDSVSEFTSWRFELIGRHVPEPTPLALLAVGVVGAFFRRRFRP